MVTLEQLLKKGEKVVKGEKKKPKENELRNRYNLDALLEIAKRTLKNGEAYQYPHGEFADVIGFEPVAKTKKLVRDENGKIIDEIEIEYNVSLPNDLRVFIESKNIEGFEDTVRIRMSRNGNVIVEPYKEFQIRKKKNLKKKKKIYEK